MRPIGLRAELLLNILLLTAVAMFLVGVIAFKVTERFALQGQIDGLESVAAAFDDAYLEEGDTEEGVEFVKEVLEPGAWGVVARGGKRTEFSKPGEELDESANKSDPLILEAINSGRTAVRVYGYNLPPFSTFESLKVAVPLSQSGDVLLMHQPLKSFDKSIILSQKLIALWIILFLIVIALFGYYLISRRVVKPMDRLIRATENIAKGRPPHDVDTGNVNEIEKLHNALCDMYDEIELSKSELSGKIDELEDANKKLLDAQRELIAAEKLASLGKLSAGVAHEIGNPLSAIRGYLEVLVGGDLSDETKKAEILTNIENETGRIDRIIHTLLDYSRPRDAMTRPIQLNEVVRQSVEIVSSQGVAKNINIVLDLKDPLPEIEGDPHQISQVFINLLLNSRDAMNDSGEIRISSDFEPDQDIMIVFEDTGGGIEPLNHDRIFDPFFTTKEPGQGTGLGLSVSARIVENFGGTIKVDGSYSEGARFVITFPEATE